MLRSPQAIRWALLTGLTFFLVAASPAEVPTPVRELDVQGYHVRLDLSRQVLGIKIPDDRVYGERGVVETPIAPTLPTGRGAFISGSMLSQKAKQFDDGLYAAVERAAQDGAGKFQGKAAMLQSLAKALATLRPAEVTAESPPAIVLAAGRLGRLPVAVPPGVESALVSTEKAFLSNPLRSEPIGVYTWSPALESIFRQDRMLQSEFKGKTGIESVARALHANPEARATYESYLALVTRMTNPLATPSLQPLLHELDSGQVAVPDKGLAFFPTSQAHETELIKRLYGNRPIPEGFSLVDEMIKRIQGGALDLRPTRSSGWYDHQTWALEPLVIPDRMPEASHLQTDDSYRKQLRELFKGILALTRETHIKQLELPAAGAAAPMEGQVTLHVAPELAAEPLPTYYLRRGESYRFIREVLENTFGADALRQMHRETAGGPVAIDLAAELDQMQGLFLGAAAKVNRQLGMPAAGDTAVFDRWAAAVANDPDLGKDARMMVPLFYDLGRRKTKVWVFLGWSQRPAHVWFANPPVAEISQNGQKADPKRVKLEFGSNYPSLSYPVTAEVYVTSILNRDEFRRHCDTHKTQAAILKNLR